MPTPPGPVQSGLRNHALALKEERSRGHIPLRVWAGDPRHGPDSASVVQFDPTDHVVDDADRAEITLALANAVTEHVPQPICWVTRSGSPDFCSADLAWLSAADRSWRELELPPSFVVLTREGWAHHPSGARRRWKRLRDQS